ncbi:copper homeostasis membrane protein CopD [Nitrobacter sp. JJSN]|uniref:copper homeostasis membrane protein CopD n=1 Tax=Nitrobacter sp. JJSN TaxID=3453033 RepID=UPI003F765134
MDLLGAGIDGPLIVIRAIHFAATAIIAGTLIFRAVVAEPALRSTQVATTVVRSQIHLTAWIGLAIAAATGVIWLQLQAVSMSGLHFGEAMTSGVLSTVVNKTQFGLVSTIRFVLAIILAACLASDRLALSRWSGLASALGLIAAIAWTGHAGSTSGETGYLHLMADALHLIAAAAWLGGLVSLALLLAAAWRYHALAWVSLARDAAQRFSTLGIVSVATLLVSGIINSWILVGSVHALLITQYGQLLMLKVIVFVIMLMFAAANRFWLTPQLVISSENEAQLEVLRQLTRNSLIEIALGFAIFAIVGALGTLHPAIHGL